MWCQYSFMHLEDKTKGFLLSWEWESIFLVLQKELHSHEQQRVYRAVKESISFETIPQSSENFSLTTSGSFVNTSTCCLVLLPFVKELCSRRKVSALISVLEPSSLEEHCLKPSPLLPQWVEVVEELLFLGVVVVVEVVHYLVVLWSTHLKLKSEQEVKTEKRSNE